MSRFELAHADTCLPDYWCGHHKPHLSIPVYAGMTLEDIKDALHLELNQGAIAGTIPDDLTHNGYDLTEEGYSLFKEAIDNITANNPEQKTFFNDLEPEEEDADFSVYAYFVFIDNEQD